MFSVFFSNLYQFSIVIGAKHVVLEGVTSIFPVFGFDFSIGRIKLSFMYWIIVVLLKKVVLLQRQERVRGKGPKGKREIQASKENNIDASVH
jgi:hypothetical protein